MAAVDWLRGGSDSCARDVDLIFFFVSSVTARDGRSDGSPPEGRVQLRQLREERHACGEGLEDAWVPQDRDYHRRFGLSGTLLFC